MWEPATREWGRFTQPLPRQEAELQYGVNLKRGWTYRAMNRLIQGSSADMIKLAMLKIWKECGVATALTIHDEIDLSVGSEELALKIDECVRTSVELLVPIVTDMERGPSWGETEKWECKA